MTLALSLQRLALATIRGLGAALVFLMLIRITGPNSDAIAAIVGFAVLTLSGRGKSERDLGRLFDAFGGAYTKERVREILKDDSMGTFGVASIVSVLILQVTTVAVLPGSLKPFALLVSPVLAEWTGGFASQKGFAFSTGLVLSQLLLIGLLLLCFHPILALLLLCACIATGLYLSRLWHRRVGDDSTLICARSTASIASAVVFLVLLGWSIHAPEIVASPFWSGLQGSD